MKGHRNLPPKVALDRTRVRRAANLLAALLAFVAAGGLLISAARAQTPAPDGESRQITSADMLLAAAQANRIDILKYLLDRGGDPNAAGADGSTALMVAVAAGHRNAVDYLLAHGADANRARADGWTALMVAADSGNAPLVTVLVKAGADLEAREKRDGLTALMIAARGGSAETVAAFVEADTDLSARDTRRGLTALHHALQSRRDLTPEGPRTAALAIAAELMVSGAEIDAAAADGWTPLMSALDSGEEARVRLVLDAGANADARTVDGRTPLSIAAARGAPGLVRLLLERGALAAGELGSRAVVAATAAGSLELVRIITDAGASLDGADAKGRTPLIIAAGSGMDDIVDYLLIRGARPNAANPNDGTTALMWAANAGYIEIVRALLSAGGDPTLVAHDGWTAVEAAEMAGHDAIAKLLRRGA